MERLLSLDADEARDARVVGVKAAGLARARVAGLPALIGWVVPAGEGNEAGRIGAEALRRRGPAAACLAVGELELDGPLRRDLRAVLNVRGGSAIVRSSSERDADPRWAGAFASYLDVGSADVPTAVLGCWASAFSRDAVARGAALGVSPELLRLAVLVQPWVAFDGGGTAEIASDGWVRIAAATGAPSDLVRGRRPGALYGVARDGTVTGEAEPEQLKPEVLRAVASLARDTARATGYDAIEWGMSEGRIVLLQARPRANRNAPSRPRRPRPMPAGMERIARLATRFPAPLGERLVLPWAVSLEEVPEWQPIVLDPNAALDEALRLADELAAYAWGERGDADEVAASFRALLGEQPEAGLARLARSRPVHPAKASRLLGLVAGIGDELLARGRLSHSHHVWRLSPEELERAVSSSAWSPPARLGPDRWEPVVFETVMTHGRSRSGAPAAPGVGAGPLFLLDGRTVRSHPLPRAVLAVREPLPHLAPLLWNRAGLVAASGSQAAHLFEVARSLGVPAVLGVDVARLVEAAEEGTLVAVDGHAGEVSVLPAREAGEASIRAGVGSLGPGVHARRRAG